MKFLELKKTAIIAALSVFMVAFVCSTPFPVTGATASSATSSAIVIFSEGTGPVTPRDPDNPTIDSTNPGTGASGSLTIDYISPLEFGNQYIDTTKATYSSITLKPYLQVSDRRGVIPGLGWKVQASATAFTHTVNSGIKLTGATIVLKHGEALSGFDASTGLNPVDNVVITTDGQNVTVLVATTGQGIGTWVERWYPSTPSGAAVNDNVLLTVPANPVSGTYKATITWSLIDAP